MPYSRWPQCDRCGASHGTAGSATCRNDGSRQSTGVRQQAGAEDRVELPDLSLPPPSFQPLGRAIRLNRISSDPEPGEALHLNPFDQRQDSPGPEQLTPRPPGSDPETAISGPPPPQAPSLPPWPRGGAVQPAHGWRGWAPTPPPGDQQPPLPSRLSDVLAGKMAPQPPKLFSDCLIAAMAEDGGVSPPRAPHYSGVSPPRAPSSASLLPNPGPRDQGSRSRSNSGTSNIQVTTAGQ